MNSITTVKNELALSKETVNLIIKGGKYGCFALGIYALYDLCVKAMENGYAFNINYDSEGKISIQFTPPTVAAK